MKKLGFTLAEVLITLVIIGVIAAMTVPTLMNNTQGTENKTAFKKAISSLNQALTLEYALEGNTAASADIIETMKKRTNVINTKGEWYTGTTKGSATDGILVTADGIIYDLTTRKVGTAAAPISCPGETLTSTGGYPTDTCGYGRVDVNGVKGPNVQVTDPAKPQDQFYFTIYETKVLPGTANNTFEAAVMYDNKDTTSFTKSTAPSA